MELEKVKAGTWDYAKEAAEDAAKEAERIRQANEEVAKSYTDIETSAKKAFSVKYATPNKDLIAQSIGKQTGNEPRNVTMHQQVPTMWQNTVNLMKSTIQNFVPNMKYGFLIPHLVKEPAG